MDGPPLPRSAAWQHVGARTGFEVALLDHDHAPDDSGTGPPPVAAVALVLSGTTTAVEDGVAWVVSYRIGVDTAWRTREARVRSTSAAGVRQVQLLADGDGGWRIDGRPAEHLAGCLDVDLESSALTNTLPVHRLGLGVGRSASAPAAFVRALDLRVERLEQTYARLPDGERERYAYSAPVFDVRCELVYGDDRLVDDYPGIARRVAGMEIHSGLLQRS